MIKIKQACEKPGIKWYKLRWILNKDKWIDAIHWISAYRAFDDVRWYPPFNGRGKRIDCKDDNQEYVVSFLDDGHFIGIGYPDKWHVIMRRGTFFKMALWSLCTYVFYGWCGIREWIFYKTLTKICDRTKRSGKK